MNAKCKHELDEGVVDSAQAGHGGGIVDDSALEKRREETKER